MASLGHQDNVAGVEAPKGSAAAEGIKDLRDFLDSSKITIPHGRDVPGGVVSVWNRDRRCGIISTDQSKTSATYSEDWI